MKRDFTKKGWEDSVELDLDNVDNQIKVEFICNRIVFIRKLDLRHLAELYFPISWKRFFKKENMWEFVAIVQHLKKGISIFHKDYFDKFKASSTPVGTTLSMAKPAVSKQKRGKSSRWKTASNKNAGIKQKCGQALESKRKKLSVNARLSTYLSQLSSFCSESIIQFINY